MVGRGRDIFADIVNPRILDHPNDLKLPRICGVIAVVLAQRVLPRQELTDKGLIHDDNLRASFRVGVLKTSSSNKRNPGSGKEFVAHEPLLRVGLTVCVGNTREEDVASVSTSRR